MSGDLRWIENSSGDGSTWVNRLVPGGHQTPRAFVAVDVDADGDLDVVSASGQGDNKFTLNENRTIHRNALFDVESVIASSGATSFFTGVGADLDGDGDVDAVSVDSSALRWYDNDGGAPSGWTGRDIATGLTFPQLYEAGDINGDGDVDLLARTDVSAVLRWYDSDGATPPAFTSRTIDISAGVGGLGDAALVDLDGDGDLDAVTSSNAVLTDSIFWYENGGGALPGWTKRLIRDVTESPRTIVAGDIDDDGDLDLAVVDGTQLDLYTSDGAALPTFTLQAAVQAVNGNALALADIDADSDLDVILEDGGTLYWLENQGLPGSSALRTIGATGTVFSVSARDADQDGDVDVFIGTSTEFRWFESSGGALPTWTSRPIVGGGHGACRRARGLRRRWR